MFHHAWKELDQLEIDTAVRQWRARLCACVSARQCSGWTLWTYSVTEINLVIYFEWLVPYLLLNCKHRFFCKSYVERSCFVAVFRVLHFTRYETTILRCVGLYCYCLIYKLFLRICWKFDENTLLKIDENTYTTTQIMTKNARFLFFRSQCTFHRFNYFESLAESDILNKVRTYGLSWFSVQFL